MVTLFKLTLIIFFHFDWLTVHLFSISSLQNFFSYMYMHDFAQNLSFCCLWSPFLPFQLHIFPSPRYRETTKHAVIFDLLYDRISKFNCVGVLIHVFLSLGCNLTLWYEVNNKFWCILLYLLIPVCGNRKPTLQSWVQDDLRNWLDMTSHEYTL